MAERRGLKPADTRSDDRSAMVLAYAKAMAGQVIHDPDGKTSRRTTRSYGGYTKENIEEYLKAPSANEKNLRDASISLYQTNTRYRSLLQYYANLPCWVYTISPVNFNPEKVKPENFKKQYLKVCNILESMGIPKILREITLTALREGAYYGCIWGGTGDGFILQKLDPNYCTIVSIGDGGVYQFKYDMSNIKQEDLETYYPPQFQDMYNAYKNGGSKYQLVPPEISVCLKADTTIPEYSIPIFSGLLPTLFQIKNIEELSENSSELSNYKLLAGKIPVDGNGVPVIDYNTAMAYYSHIANNVGERVGVAISPFDLKDYSFEQSGNTAQIDTVSRASENFFAAAGTSALLHGATNSTSGVTKLAIKTDETIAFGFMFQCEKIINRFLKTLSGTVKFKTHFLEISCFNREDKIAELRSSLNYGIGKLEFIAAMGIPQHDLLGESFIEKSILDIDNLFTPLKTSSTQSSETVASGRPKSGDNKISDNGEATRDNDQNDNK